MFIYLFLYLSISLFICLFIYLFVYFFIYFVIMLELIKSYGLFLIFSTNTTTNPIFQSQQEMP